MAKVGPVTTAEIELAVIELSEAEFIHKNIPYRRCCQFVQHKDEAKIDTCQCGHCEDQHHESALLVKRPSSEKWTAESYTQQVYEADSFGEIKFNNKKRAKYVRLDSTMINGDNMRYVTDLMLKYWNLSVPNLIITVTGGALSFNLSRRVSQKFRQGIVRAAQSTGAWIITGGTHAGVMKHTGKAVRDCAIQKAGLSDVVCIGIVPWGVVDSRQDLVGAKGEGKYPARYHVPKVPKDPSHPDARRVYLDPYHTHFIMVDDGSQGKFATEIKLRTALEERISKMSPTSDKSVKVPVCCVVLQGGPGTLKTVHEAVKLGTPVVIVKDSGKMADVLATGYLESGEAEEVLETDAHGMPTKTRLITVMSDDLRSKLRTLLSAESTDSANVETWLKWIEDSLHVRDLITIYQLDAEDVTTDLDLAILLSLFKARKQDIKMQLKLSVAWNRVDVAEQYLFDEERRWPRGFFNDVAYAAFVHDRVEFVKLFLKNGLNLKDFLSILQLAKLYSECPEYSPLQRMLSEGAAYNESRYKISLYQVGRLLEVIFDDLNGHPYCTSDRYNWIETGRLLEIASELEQQHSVRKESLAVRASAVRRTSRASLKSALSHHSSSSHSETVFTTKLLHNGVYPWRRALNEEQERNMYMEAIDLTNKRRITIGSKKIPYGKVVSHFDDPAFDLFLYCILLNRLDMAMVCYEEVREALPAALTAVKIFRTLASQVDDNEAQAQFEEQASRFETVAYDVLTECFESAPLTAQLLLIRKVSLLSCRTCLDIAHSAHAIHFISHPCCQTLFNRAWFGRIKGANSKVKQLQIAAACFMPPLLYSLRYDKSSDNSLLSAKSESGKVLTKKSKRSKEKKRSAFNGLAKISHFYNAPIVIFILTIISHMCFLLLMSYDLLILYPTYGINWSQNWTEILLVIYVSSYFCEQIRAGLLGSESGSKLYSFYRQITGAWNIMDFMAIIFFVLAMIFGNLINVSATITNAGRIFYAFSCMLFFFRILHWYAIDQNLGPKVVIMAGMLKNLITYMGVLLVIVIGWGIAEYALLFPQAPAQWTLIRDVLSLSYLQVFAQFYFNVIRQQPFDVPASGTCTNDPDLYSNYTMIRCSDSTGQLLVPVLLALFMMLTNLLLQNLLTATFAYTFSAVQVETDQHWSYQRFKLISEFNSKPQLVPPFIFISHLLTLIRVIYCAIKGIKYRSWAISVSFRVRLEDRDDDSKRDWMCNMKDEYIRKMRNQSEDLIDSQVITMGEKMEQACATMQSLALVPLGDAEKMNSLLVHLQHVSSIPTSKQIREALENQHHAQVKGGTTSGNGSITSRLSNELKHVSENATLAIKMLQKILSAQESTHGGAASTEVSPSHGGTERRRSISRAGCLRPDTATHKNARHAVYPQMHVDRYPVPDNKVSWKAQFKRYNPNRCNAEVDVLLKQYVDCDPDLLSLAVEKRDFTFNQHDARYRCNRVATVFYRVIDGLPMNPNGRTGVFGRGMLPRWGPNQALMFALLRHKVHHEDHGAGSKRLEGKKRLVLEVLMQKNATINKGYLPYSLLEMTGLNALLLLKVMLKSAIGLNKQLNAEQRDQLLKKIEQLFASQARTVYSGYADSELNTDNAWVEAQCVALLLPDDLAHAVLPLGDQYFWTEVSAVGDLAVENHNVHKIYKKIAQHYGAHF